MEGTIWGVLSVTFVWIYFTLNMGSLFLSSVGISIIVLSFPLALAIGKICTVYYVGIVHCMLFFIVIGIAADDFFVFMDAWRQSAEKQPIKNDFKRRMAYTIRRSSRAMAITSATTSVSFFANAFSPIMPIKSFGIYAGIIVPLNFFLTVFMFTPAITIYETQLVNVCTKKEPTYDLSSRPD